MISWTSRGISPKIQGFGLVLGLLILVSLVPTSSIHPAQTMRTSTSEPFFSTTVQDNYTVYLSLPPNYDPNITYSTLYVLDADWYFDGSHERLSGDGMVGIVDSLTTGGELRELILVGIGYPTTNNRGRDFLENNNLFHNFLKDELVPWVEAEYSADPEDRWLFGHSDGGYFAIYALTSYNRIFHRFIALSGDYTKFNRSPFSWERALSRRVGTNATFPVSLFMGVGSFEEKRFTESNAELADMFSQRGYNLFHFDYHSYQSLNHGSVVRPGIRDGLRWLNFNTPKSSYDFLSQTYYTGDPISFTFNGTQGTHPVQFTWDFGDGTRSSDINVTHSYERSGSYIVNLTLSSESYTSWYVPTFDNGSLQFLSIIDPLTMMTDTSANSQTSQESEANRLLFAGTGLVAVFSFYCYVAVYCIIYRKVLSRKNRFELRSYWDDES